MSNKFDLEEKMDLLYNFNYNTEFPNCYELDKINYKGIKLEDIKIPNSNEHIIEQLKSDIFKGKFKLIRYDNDNNEIILKRYSDHFPVTVFITPYKNLKSLNLMNNSNNNDSMFSYLLSNLVLNRLTNHILLPIVNLDVNYKQISDSIENILPNNDLINNIQNDKISDLFSIRVKEHFFRSIPLIDYMSDNVCSFKPLLFQIIHTLAVIQKEHNGFRHNNLDVRNIFIYLKKDKDNQTKYSFNKKDYYLKNNDFDIKITNFSKSTLPNSEYSNKKIPFSNKKNNYFDLHYFINTLFFKNKINKCNKETEDFLMEIIPKKLRGKGKHNYYLESNVELFDPAKLLNHTYFQSYTKKNDNIKLFLNNIYQGFKRKHLNNIENNNLFNGSRFLKKDVAKSLKKLSKSNKGMKKSSKLNYRKLKQTGGGNKNIKPPYTKEKNSPHISNDEKNVHQRNENTTIAEQHNVSNDQRHVSERRNNETTNNDFNRNSTEQRRSYPDQSNIQREFPRGGQRGPPRGGQGGPPRGGPRGPPRGGPRGPPRGGPRGPPRGRPRGPPRGSSNSPYHSGSNNNPPPPLYIPVGDSYYPSKYHTLPQPYGNYINKNIPIQKTYNINLSNARGNGHGVLNRVYEDMIPGNQYPIGFTSFFDREQFYNYVRTLLINDHDGEEMNITGGKNSLLESIKLQEINPYALGLNPYKELSKGFLMYNSSYPIRYNNSTNSIETPKSSNALNVRIYQLSLGAFRSNNISKNINWYNFDVWREIKYYEFVRSTILKAKESPNFVCLLLYKIDTESKLDWNKLTQLIYKSDPNSVLKRLNEGEKLINKQHNLKETNVLGYLLSRGKLPTRTNVDNYLKRYMNRKMNQPGIEFFYKRVNDAIEVIKVVTNSQSTKSKVYIYDKSTKSFSKIDNSTISDKDWNKCSDIDNCLSTGDITTDSGRSLVAVTESPTHNIITWCSPQYQGQGSVKTMISTGHRTVKEWKSVLFQFVYTFAVLQKHKILFENLSLENNFFIKDTYANSSNLGYWIYKSENINFYVPNYGYILLFDSKYVDTKYNNDNTIDKKLDINKKRFKIISDTLYQNNNGDRNGIVSNIQAHIYHSFKNIIYKSNFNNILKKHGAHIPHNDITKLLDDMYNNSETDIFKYLLKYFKEYCHNKIGLTLTENEHKLINLSVRPIIKAGKMCVLQLRFNEYIWVQVVKAVGTNRTRILMKNSVSNSVEDKIVANHRLLAFHQNETVSLNPPLNDSNLIESYDAEFK